MISISKEQARGALSEASRQVLDRLPPSLKVSGIAIPSSAVLQVVNMEELIDNIYSRQVNVEAGDDAEITVRIS